MKQDKTTLKPPFDPEPFTVIAVQGSKVTAERDNKTKCRNQAKWKLMKDRPPHLVPNKANRGGGNKSEDEDTDDESYIRIEALANRTGEASHGPQTPRQPESPSSPTLQARSPPQPTSPTAASPQPYTPAQPRPSVTPAAQPTVRTAATGPGTVQGEALQSGRPKRHPKPVQRFGAEQENTITDDSPKLKGKNPSPKERKKRKAEARKREKTKGEAWMMTPSNTQVMKFKKLPGN